MTEPILNDSRGVALMYHRVGLPRLRSIVSGQYVTPWLISRQIDYLRSRGLSSCSLIELPDADESSPCFAITFDDGYLSVCRDACPLLLSKNVPATIFVVAGAIGGINQWDRAAGDVIERMMGADQIREVAATGFEIGSHTMTHPRLSKLSPDDLKRELVDSKKLLEDIIGREVTSFSYPYGDYSPEVLEAVREAGYRRATATKLGTVRSDCPAFEIPRVNVRWNLTGPLLAKKIIRAENQ